MKRFTDLGHMSEDARIDMIGNVVLGGPQSSSDAPINVAFIVDDDAKADRYVDKLKKKFPTIRVITREPGPAGTIVVRVGGPLR